jgi:transcriptional regulator with XRE-family HTH domain
MCALLVMVSQLAEILSNSPEKLTGRQIRAARIFAGKTQGELAKKMGISPRRLIDAEAAGSAPIEIRPERATIIALITIFLEWGVRFTENEGVCRADTI